MLIAKGRITLALPSTALRRDLLHLGLVEIPVNGAIGIVRPNSTCMATRRIGSSRPLPR
ncbi:MAG: hypothetical protein ACU84H_02330 [Gammaproteobacteria bacterium]